MGNFVISPQGLWSVSVIIGWLFGCRQTDPRNKTHRKSTAEQLFFLVSADHSAAMAVTCIERQTVGRYVNFSVLLPCLLHTMELCLSGMFLQSYLLYLDWKYELRQKLSSCVCVDDTVKVNRSNLPQTQSYFYFLLLYKDHTIAQILQHLFVCAWTNMSLVLV